MKYYQVKKEADQVVKPSKKYDVLVKDELYTEREVKQLGWSKEKIESCFKIVYVNMKKTGFLFGARFSTELQRN